MSAVDKIYLSDILNAPLEIDQDPSSEDFKFTPPAIFNSKRRIIYLDNKDNTEKLYKLNTASNKLETFSVKIDLDKYKAPLPSIDESILNVLELSITVIPVDNSVDSKIEVSCQLGTVQYEGNKIKYVAPKIKDVINYTGYPEYSKIGTDTITISATKIGFISNKLQIPVNILKFDISEDDALVDDDFSTFTIFKDNVEII